MGLFFSDLYKRWFGNRETRVIMLGLDAAGKTTVLYKLKLNESVSTVPTVGFNVETIQHNGFNMNVWDVGGQTRMRELWKHYIVNTQGMIFVVDANDVDRVEEAKTELHKMLEEDELQDAILLVYANKQDLPNAIKPNVLAEQLGLHDLKGRPWHCIGTVATNGDGLLDGLDWLGAQINERF